MAAQVAPESVDLKIGLGGGEGGGGGGESPTTGGIVNEAKQKVQAIKSKGKRALR
jgi:hypothetical protein